MLTFNNNNMRKLIFVIASLLTIQQTAFAVADTFYAQGNKIYDPCGEHFIPRGINYPVLDDWDFPANMNNGNELSNQIIQANPNIVRVTWYNDYGQMARPAYALSDLDSIITRFNRNGILTMVVLMDVTCANDYNSFNASITPWWIQPQVVALMQKHKNHIMVNIANEFGHVNWTGNPAAAYQTWYNHYTQAITSLRNAGITVPLVIDGPECGTSLDVLLQAGAGFQAHDPMHNIICSAHAYYGESLGNDSLALVNKVQQISNAGFPIIFGEAANFQTDVQPCQYSVLYTALLRACQTNEIGWLAWCWYKDHCPSRQMTTDGTFAQLSPYGEVIVNDPDFGLATKAVKTYYQTNGSCYTTSVSDNQSIDHSTMLWYQTTQTIFFKEAGSYRISSMSGAVIAKGVTTGNNEYGIDASTPAGIYVVQFISTSGNPTYTKIQVGN